MYKRAHVINNLRLLFPVAFLVGAQQITIRTFLEVTPLQQAQWPGPKLSPDAARAALGEHEQPYIFMRRTNPNWLIPGIVFGPHLADNWYLQADALGVTRDESALGISAEADASVFMLCVDERAQLRLPFNRTAYTMQERLGKYTMYRDMQLNSVMTLGVDLAEQPWTEAQLFLRFNRQQGGLVLLDESANGTVFQQWDYHDQPNYDPLPTVTLEALNKSVAPNGVAQFIARTIDPATGKVRPSNSTLYLEAVSGYLPHARVMLANGEGIFKARALDLEPGETLRIKAGFRFMPGLGDASVPVALA